jgi:hypothetical protein
MIEDYFQNDQVFLTNTGASVDLHYFSAFYFMMLVTHVSLLQLYEQYLDGFSKNVFNVKKNDFDHSIQFQSVQYQLLMNLKGKYDRCDPLNQHIHPYSRDFFHLLFQKDFNYCCQDRRSFYAFIDNFNMPLRNQFHLHVYQK